MQRLSGAETLGVQTDRVITETSRASSAELRPTASTGVLLLDHFRTPYKLVPRRAEGGVEELRVRPGGPALIWPAAAGDAPALAATVSDGAGVPIFARVLSDERLEPLLAGRGEPWSPARPVLTSSGAPLASIWQGADGSVFLPFDPNEVIANYWNEGYLQLAPGAGSRALRHTMMTAYYRVRPLLPRSIQISARRFFVRYQGRSGFPGWPIETALHDFFDLMFSILVGIAGTAIPRIAPWPRGRQWALVLTHDVEHANGLDQILPVRQLERARGLRSSWNFVPSRYDVDLELIRDIAGDGFEVGVHGLVHDGRDLESLPTWQERLPAARAAADRWGAVGFRAAAMHRNHEWMRSLKFDYDSSCPDTDPFEPQDGGCCSWLPYFNGKLVELPVTLPQDHTLFVILRHDDEYAWIQKARFLRERGGLALIDTHPDYLVDDRIFSAYERFLDEFGSDESAWKALPREVSTWWRQRAASNLVPCQQGWRIVGPAAAAGSVEFWDESW
jgi:hypothetical protein